MLTGHTRFTSAPASVTHPVADSLKVTAEKLYTEFRNPWGMAWLPDGRLLVTERSGEILVFKDNKYTGTKLTGVPKVFAEGQGGLLDIKLHPDYNRNKWIYIAYSKPVEGGATTAIMRCKIQGNELVEKKDIFLAKPFIKANFHFGSRIVFDKKNFLYFAAGERGTQPKVQELDNDHGKIHRIYDDGRVPNDNPFVSVKGAKPTIWSYGHRNPQGLAMDPRDGALYDTEHGPRGGDELNLVQPGKNYGWPVITYGMNYNGTPMTAITGTEGMEQPVTYWVPSIAACGLDFYAGDKFPKWRNDLFAGGLAAQEVRRLRLKDKKVISQEIVLKGIGRVRDVAAGPDGFIYVLLNGPDRIVRLIPAN